MIACQSEIVDDEIRVGHRFAVADEAAGAVLSQGLARQYVAADRHDAAIEGRDGAAEIGISGDHHGFGANAAIRGAGRRLGAGIN